MKATIAQKTDDYTDFTLDEAKVMFKEKFREFTVVFGNCTGPYGDPHNRYCIINATIDVDSGEKTWKLFQSGVSGDLNS